MPRTAGSACSSGPDRPARTPSLPRMSATPEAPGSSERPAAARPMLPVAITALGVVYGDIGTSPLYALRECFFGPARRRRRPPRTSSACCRWCSGRSILVISVKYLLFVMRADNRGEGGILALMALVRAERETQPRRRMRDRHPRALRGGAAVRRRRHHAGDLGAVARWRGSKVATPAFGTGTSCPITVGDPGGPVLRCRSAGRRTIGALFGPVMLVWFAAHRRARASHAHPQVARGPRRGVSPLHAVAFFARQRRHGFLVLGAVVLVVTGGEALYADMGHFGRQPIRLRLVRAGAARAAPQLLRPGRAAARPSPRRRANPFFLLAPAWALYPLVGARDRRHRHRVAGADLGRVLAHPPGGPARLLPAHDDRAHLGRRDRPDLRARGQLAR